MVGKRVTAKWLRKIGVKEFAIPGVILTVAALGIIGWQKLGPNINNNKQVFPDSGIVRMIFDGDTFELQNGVRVRLVGINAQANDERSTSNLGDLILNKIIWLEYDRYQNDKYGRILAWVWVGCEAKPKFLPEMYMFKSKNESNPGLSENPQGCKKGKLVQEELLKTGVVKTEFYKDRGELKYQKRISF